MVTLAEVEACCAPRLHVKEHIDLLWWLVWLPLLTREELARTTRRVESTLWHQLNLLVRLNLVASVSFSEAGWECRHHYYLTDLGLYVLAALDSHPISVKRLAVSYPVTQADLLSRLARPRVHLVLSELVTRLIGEQGDRLTSYQQPFQETYTERSGKRHTLSFDAAFLLQKPIGTQHAFYVHVDHPEVSQREVNAFVQRLLALRQATHLARLSMPHLLLLSHPQRYALWAEQVNLATLGQGYALLDGSRPEPAREHMDVSLAIADAADLKRGADAPIWTPLHALIEQDGGVGSQTGISSFLDRVASPALVERFSQYFSWKRALSTDPEEHPRDPLTRYVDTDLQKAAVPFIVSATPRRGKPLIAVTPNVVALSDAFYGDPLDRLSMSATLTLALTNQQKEIIVHLARHPFLSRADLLALLHADDERLLLRQIMPLLHLGLLSISTWINAPSSEARERYRLCEPALRWLACRNGQAVTSYLELAYPDRHKQQVSPRSRDVAWVQRSARGLWGKDGSQLFHTAGLYRCVRSIHLYSHRSHAYQVLAWKSTREAVRWYGDPLTGKLVSIRPDAELLYVRQESVQSLLIEYDRDTTNLSQLVSKFLCYAQYQQETRTTLPPILVITQNEQAIAKIWKARDTAAAFEVSTVVVLEEDIVRDGLLSIFSPPLSV